MEPKSPFILPRLVTELKNYNRKTFFADLIAGVTVGLVAFPLAMAFAIASGLPPETGLYCAIIAGFLISALGGSKFQIGGPTGAFVVVVSAIAAKHGFHGLLACTFLAGLFILLIGITGLGSAIKLIPRPVVIGFTNGIAVLIASTQIRDFFGIQVENLPSEFLPKLQTLISHASSTSLTSTLLATLGFVFLLFMRKKYPKIPGTIILLGAGTLLVALFKLPVELIGSRFPEIPNHLPAIKPISFNLDQIGELIPAAITIALLGSIESLLSAVVADRMGNDHHDSKTELIAQGIANMASPLFGGLPATGAIARTATNIRSGARTPVAGVIHALVLLIILLAAAPFAKLIPFCILAALLAMVAYNMGEWGEIKGILKSGKSEIAVWAVTFGLTVFADLTVAVQVGMILAALTFIRRVTGSTTVQEVTEEYIEQGHSHSLQNYGLPENVSVFRIQGPLLFGSTEKLDIIQENVENLNQHVLLRLRNMNALDATGVNALEELSNFLQQNGKTMFVCGTPPQPELLLKNHNFEKHLKGGLIFKNFGEAAEYFRNRDNKG